MPRLANKENCVGCTACVNACPQRCIEIIDDNDGFGYPAFTSSSSCIDCGYCEKVCPILKDEAEEIKVPLAYAAFSRNDTLRMESSSGGVFTELARQIIAKKGVVFGAVYGNMFEIKHRCIDNESDLWELRGAKYSESNLENSFSNILGRLKNGQKVLFSGTPCQVAGLKTFVKKEYDNLYCVDFVCHGVPSPMAWKAYIEYRAKHDADGEFPKAINLRSKSTGWSRYQYSNEFEYKDGKKCSIPSSDSLFMKLFVGNYISRISCENCMFKGYSRVSDITLGDFWGIWDIDPEMDDNKGTSVVLIQSEKGQTLWNEISDKIKFKEVTLEQASQQNPSMLTSSKANSNRNIVLDQIREGHIEECEKLFVQPKISMMSRVKGKIKRLIHIS